MKPMTPQELADFYSVSINSVYSWVSRPGFPSFKAGRRLRFNIDKVQHYFDELSEAERHPCHSSPLSLIRSSSVRSLKTRVNASRVDSKAKE